MCRLRKDKGGPVVCLPFHMAAAHVHSEGSRSLAWNVRLHCAHALQSCGRLVETKKKDNCRCPKRSPAPRAAGWCVHQSLLGRPSSPHRCRCPRPAASTNTRQHNHVVGAPTTVNTHGARAAAPAVPHHCRHPCATLLQHPGYQPPSTSLIASPFLSHPTLRHHPESESGWPAANCAAVAPPPLAHTGLSHNIHPPNRPTHSRHTLNTTSDYTAHPHTPHPPPVRVWR